MELYKKKILIADRDANVRNLLIMRLNKLDYKVYLASNGKDALLIFNKEQPDLVVLDTMLPKLDGYEVCYKIREYSKVPIIMLSPLNNISDRIMGLELGADDVLLKPFSPRELEVKIRSILNRSSSVIQKSPEKKQKKIYLGTLVVDMSTKIISKNNSRVKLTEIEYRLLELLIENIGDTLSRTSILENIWGYKPERYVDTRIVDVHISRLRAKIEKNPRKPDLIITSRGVGYTFYQTQPN